MTSMARVLLSGLLLWGLFMAPAGACPTRSSNPNDYIRRDNNRCEGILSRSVVSGSIELISLTSSRGSMPRDALTITIPASTNRSPVVLIRALEERYQLDQMDLSRSQNSYTFSLPTRVLSAVGVQLDELRATATSGSQVVYIPVILNQSTNQYRFVFASSNSVRFTRAEIRQGNRVFASWGRQLPRRGEKAFDWNNPTDAPAGRYRFSYTAEIEQRNRPPETISRTITFEHDPAWLR